MVQLGFVDEPITELYADKVDYTTNKLGGFPDWIHAENAKKKITCNVCGSVTPLLLQIYAPVKERMQYHRTLYVFACINPNCWGNPKSWKCLKNQLLVEEKLPDSSISTFPTEDWGLDANNWDCDDPTNSCQASSYSVDEAASLINRVSIDEENANEVPDVAFIEAKNCIPTAEIEPEEDEPITVDSPVIPNCNLISLLKQKPSSPKTNNANMYFMPSFIFATDEKVDKDPLTEHVQNLLSEYTRNSDNRNSLKITNNVNVVSQQSDEKYEKSRPPHGDKLFHTFLSRIKANPEQIMRYSRTNTAPLFLYTESEMPVKCQHCCSELIFEVQILPTVINYLKLPDDKRNHRDHLEFGSAFVYTCKASCDKSEEEHVIVQFEQF